jgi:hypothetical protein
MTQYDAGSDTNFDADSEAAGKSNEESIDEGSDRDDAEPVGADEHQIAMQGEIPISLGGYKQIVIRATAYVDAEQAGVREIVQPIVGYENVAEVPELRRGQRERRVIEHYQPSAWSSLAEPAVKEPITVKEAMSSFQACEWKIARNEELQLLADHGTWTLEDPPPGAKVIPCRWVFAVKRDASGNVEGARRDLLQKDSDRYKALTSRKSGHLSPSTPL